MFTSERLHSELKHGGVRAPVIVVVVVVVVEGYCFLINIIVGAPETPRVCHGAIYINKNYAILTLSFLNLQNLSFYIRETHDRRKVSFLVLPFSY